MSAVLDVSPGPQARLVLLGVDVDGLRPAGRAALRSRIAYLPADGGLLSNLNAWEYRAADRLPSPAAAARSRLGDGLARGLVDDPRALLAKLPENDCTRKTHRLCRDSAGETGSGAGRGAAGWPGFRGKSGRDRFPAAYHALSGGTYVRLEIASGLSRRARNPIEEDAMREEQGRPRPSRRNRKEGERLSAHGSGRGRGVIFLVGYKQNLRTPPTIYFYAPTRSGSARAWR